MAAFESFFRKELVLRKSRTDKMPVKGCRTGSGKDCAICPGIRLSYAAELEARQAAFSEFWKVHRLPGIVHSLIPSPKPRRYRSVSKRRAFRTRHGQVLLGLTDILDSGKVEAVDVLDCPIEPAEHSAIYRHIQFFLNTQESWLLTKLLNHVIIKGNYDEYAVILNVHAIPPDLKRQVRLLSKEFKVKFRKVSAMFTVASDYSRYYLPDQAAAKSLTKVFGENELFLRIDQRAFLFSPLAFSQTNESVLAPMTAKARALLPVGEDTTLLDLYAGYGLFGLLLGGTAAAILGMESNHPAVVSAQKNARRLKMKNCRMVCSAVTAESLSRIWPKGEGNVTVILDPPRQGTDDGVIEYLAHRRVSRALHIYCDVDAIPEQSKRWRKNGYEIAEVVPVDMFPATASLEVMVLYRPVSFQEKSNMKRTGFRRV